jgi:hypothetical protein
MDLPIDFLGTFGDALTIETFFTIVKCTKGPLTYARFQLSPSTLKVDFWPINFLSGSPQVHTPLFALKLNFWIHKLLKQFTPFIPLHHLGLRFNVACGVSWQQGMKFAELMLKP